MATTIRVDIDGKTAEVSSVNNYTKVNGHGVNLEAVIKELHKAVVTLADNFEVELPRAAAPARPDEAREYLGGIIPGPGHIR